MRYILAMFLLLGIHGFAQGLYSVATCRDARDTWITSTNLDLSTLTMSALVTRTQELNECAQKIDNTSVKLNMSKAEALHVMVGQYEYELLMAAYTREAYTRIALFINDKRMFPAFHATDTAGNNFGPPGD